ncbi:hypothetical protein FOA52_007025 [Chlamydomonas sp. UWO 241]|nr:hypothetical protein FOA52_007025 [Chlamydomonas sp. UWO 241]
MEQFTGDVSEDDAKRYPSYTLQATNDQVLADSVLFYSTLEDLRKYLGADHIDLTRVPCVDKIQVDLHMLYQEVIKLGGLDNVTKNKNWSQACEKFNFPPSCTNKSTIIKRLYCRALHHYEQLYFQEDRAGKPLVLPPCVCPNSRLDRSKSPCSRPKKSRKVRDGGGAAAPSPAAGGSGGQTPARGPSGAPVGAAFGALGRQPRPGRGKGARGTAGAASLPVFGGGVSQGAARASAITIVSLAGSPELGKLDVGAVFSGAIDNLTDNGSVVTSNMPNGSNFKGMLYGGALPGAPTHATPARGVPQSARAQQQQQQHFASQHYWDQQPERGSAAAAFGAQPPPMAQQQQPYAPQHSWEQQPKHSAAAAAAAAAFDAQPVPLAFTAAAASLGLQRYLGHAAGHMGQLHPHHVSPQPATRMPLQFFRRGNRLEQLFAQHAAPAPHAYPPNNEPMQPLAANVSRPTSPDLLFTEPDHYVGDWSAYSAACLCKDAADAVGAGGGGSMAAAAAPICAARQPQQQPQGEQQIQQQPEMQQPRAQVHELQMTALHMLGGAQYAEQQQQQQQQQQCAAAVHPHSHVLAASSPHQLGCNNSDGDAALSMLVGFLLDWMTIEEVIQEQEDLSLILRSYRCSCYSNPGSQGGVGGQSHHGSSGGGGGGSGGNNGVVTAMAI